MGDEYGGYTPEHEGGALGPVLLAQLTRSHAEDPTVDTAVLGADAVRAIERRGMRIEDLREIARALGFWIIVYEDAPSTTLYLTNGARFIGRGRTFLDRS